MPSLTTNTRYTLGQQASTTPSHSVPRGGIGMSSGLGMETHGMAGNSMDSEWYGF